MTGHALAVAAAEFAASKKALDVMILDLRNLSDVTDYYVLCSGESDTQVKAITDAIIDGMERSGVKSFRREGYTNLQWVLLDFFDVVVHIFHQRTREYYELERLWGDAPVEVLQDAPPA